MAAPARIPTSPHADEVIAEFARRRDAGRYDGLPAHHQPFDEPYVVRHRVAGGLEIDVLIANENAMHWYEDPQRTRATAVYSSEFDLVVELGLFGPGQLAAYAGPTSHVVAFEPSAIGSDLVELNARLNGLDNVTAVRAVVGAAPGTTA